MADKEREKPIYDLEDRTFQFAKAVRILIKTLPKNISIIEDSRQLIRASGSVGANYREANEALSREDFLMRIRISRREAKECAYWLRLIRDTNEIAQTVLNSLEVDLICGLEFVIL